MKRWIEIFMLRTERFRTWVESQWIAWRLGCNDEALIKACFDIPFDYALQLRSGAVIRFSGARPCGKGFVRLEIFDEDLGIQVHPFPYKFDRGIEVRVSEIVWVADAPQGS